MKNVQQQNNIIEEKKNGKEQQNPTEQTNLKRKSRKIVDIIFL
jgi:hypothetical protein